MAEPVEGVSATPYEDNIRYFNVAIAGPLGTTYEGDILIIMANLSLVLIVLYFFRRIVSIRTLFACRVSHVTTQS